jgi:hypothetical protein
LGARQPQQSPPPFPSIPFRAQKPGQFNVQPRKEAIGLNFNLFPHKPEPPAWPLTLGGFIALFLLRVYLHLTCSGILWNLIGKHLFDLAFGLATLGLIAWAVVDLIRSLPELPLTPAPPPEPPTDVRFSAENITQTFIASIPPMTPEFNLELATATQWAAQLQPS